MKWGLVRTWWDALPRGLETVKQRFFNRDFSVAWQRVGNKTLGRIHEGEVAAISGPSFLPAEAFWRNLFARNQARRALSSVASLLTLPTKHVLFLSVT